MRSAVSDDMINVMLRQMGAVSIKTSPAYISIAKFEIGELRLTYMYEVKDEHIYLQRVDPYPMMIGKIYNDQQVVEIIAADLQKFKNAYNSSNFSRFLHIASDMSSINVEIENLFMRHNVSKADLERIDAMMDSLHDKLSEMEEDSPFITKPAPEGTEE